MRSAIYFSGSKPSIIVSTVIDLNSSRGKKYGGTAGVRALHVVGGVDGPIHLSDNTAGTVLHF